MSSSQQPSAQQLPFQPINSRQESANSDSLYQQKLNERSMLDMTSHNQPQSQSQQHQIQLPSVQPQTQLNFNPPISPPSPSPSPAAPHPSVLAMFLSLSSDAQQRFALANPVAYAQLCVAAQQQFQFQEPPTAESQIQVQVKTKKKSKKVNAPARVLSDSDNNFHSSDEELNIKEPSHASHASHSSHVAQANAHHLPLDFRNNLCNITDQGYVLRWPRQYRNVCEIELIDCTMNRSPILDKEPYIYMSILEIPGEYALSGGREEVFGKLIPEKTVNEFIFYKPEHCRKVFSKPIELENITVSFLQYDKTRILLSKLDIRNLSQGSGGEYYKLNTRGQHYLTEGDNVSITYRESNRVTVEILPVMDAPTPDTVILESSSKGLKSDDRCSFEKVQLKCSLTFKVKVI
jgi:hypothetical protein